MLCWICAGFSFWAAAAMFGVYAVIEGAAALHRARVWPRLSRHLPHAAR